MASFLRIDRLKYIMTKGKIPFLKVITPTTQFSKNFQVKTIDYGLMKRFENITKYKGGH